MKKVRWIAVIAACVAAATLAACDNNAFSSPVAIKEDGQYLLVAMCGDLVEVERVYISARNESGGADWVRFWDAEGKVTLAEGQVFSLQEGIDGLAVSVDEAASFTDGTDIAITMVSVAPGESLSADFEIRGGDLAADVWLNPDGSTSSEACGEPGGAHE